MSKSSAFFRTTNWAPYNIDNNIRLKVVPVAPVAPVAVKI